MEKLTKEQIPGYISVLVKRAKVAQKIFERTYTDQRKIDEVVRAIGKSVWEGGAKLAADAASETGMGNAADKIAQLGSAIMHWNTMKGKKTVGIIDEPRLRDVKVYAKPLGVIGCVMPSTNPIGTIVGNSMSSLKCRNAVIIAPHPASVNVSKATIEIMRNALKEIGAPEDLVQGIGPEAASIEATQALLRECDVNIATGGAPMVKSVYSAGRPAFGVGQGNCQSIIDEDSPDMATIAAHIVKNRSSNQGTPCTGEQMVHVPAGRETDFIEAMQNCGAFLITDRAVIDNLRELVFPDGGPINRKVVGKPPSQIGKMLGIDIPEDKKVILLKYTAKGTEDILCKEILCPMVRYRTYTDFNKTVALAVETLEVEGAGHSSAIWSHNQERIDYAATMIPVGRFHVNQSSSGGLNGLPATVTIGCGSWGNNSISENLQYYHLMNKTHVTVPLSPEKAHIPCAEDWDIWE